MISNIRSYRHSLILFLIPVGLAITAGVFFIYISSNGQIGFVAGLIFILVGLYPFARAWMRREFDAFEIINLFVLYMILCIGIRGLVGIKYGSHFLFYDPDSDYFDILSLKTFSYSTIALLSLYVGYYSGLGNRWLNRLPRLNFDWQKTRVIICLIIYFIISEVATILFTVKFGNWEGISSFGRNPSAIQGHAVEGGHMHIGAFLYFFWVVMYVSCIYVFSKKSPIWAKILLLFCLLQIVISFLHSGVKSSIVFAILAYMITRHYLKKMASLKMYGFIIAGMLALYPLLVYFRCYGIYGNLELLRNIYVSALKNPADFMNPLLMRSYGFDSFALFIDAIDSGKGLELGRPMALLFYFFIPRVWWTEKPQVFSVTFVEKYAGVGDPSCWAPSLVGELYVNFHLIGIILGFLLLGILMKLCYQCLIKRNHNKSSLLIYLPIVIYAPLIFEVGTSIIQNYLLALFPIILFLWFVKSKSRGVN